MSDSDSSTEQYIDIVSSTPPPPPDKDYMDPTIDEKYPQFLSFVRDTIYRHREWCQENGIARAHANFDMSIFDSFQRNAPEQYIMVSLTVDLELEFPSVELYGIDAILHTTTPTYETRMATSYDEYIDHIANEFDWHRDWYIHQHAPRFTFQINVSEYLHQYLPDDTESRCYSSIHRDIVQRCQLDLSIDRIHYGPGTISIVYEM